MKKKFKIIFALVAFLAILASFCAGCVGKNALCSPTGVRVNDDYVLTWTDVVSARGYEVRVNKPDGTNVTVQSSRRANIGLSFLEEGDYKIAIRSLGDGTKYADSKWSEEFDFHKNYESGCIYRLINNNSEYEISSAGSSNGAVTIEDYYRDKPVTAIGDSAFKQSLKLTKITIGGKITSIGGNAFFSCSNLEEVKLSQSVKRLGSAAFQSCDKIKEIILPDGLEDISSFAFAYCSGLSAIDLTHVKTIGESAFSNCSGLTSIDIPDGVTSIDSSSFFRCISAETLTIGSGIEYIPKQAFGFCENLKTVNFSDGKSLKILGQQCFEGCNSLVKLNLPYGLKSVGDEAFNDCGQLSEVIIPDSVTAIESGAFNGTKTYNDAIEAGDKLIYVGDWLVASTKDALIGVTRLSSDNLKKGIVGIAGSVFLNRPSNEHSSWEFNVPASLKYIGTNAFRGTQVWRVASSNGSKLYSIGYGAFSNCERLTNLYLSDGLEVIDSYAFNGCKLLANSTQISIIPSTVERVGAYAFRDTALYNEPDDYGVVYAGIKGLESWVVDYVGDQMNPITSVDLKSSVYGIADQAFAGCADIRSITGVNRASIVGSYAFASCEKLIAVALNPILDTIKAGTFYGCEALTDVSLPSRIKTIEDKAFMSCTNLVTVKNIGSNSLTSIGYAAFAYCENLSFDGDGNALTFGTNMKELGEYAFFACNSLNNVTIPDGLRVISAHAFSQCDSLENFDFGNGVVEIGDYAFFYQKTEADKTDETETNETRADINATGVRINLPASVKKIGNYAFFGCKGVLEKGVLSARLGGVETIGEYAFSNAELGTVTLPSSLKSIGKYAFYKAKINSVTIGESVENIDRHAFNGCGGISFYCAAESRPESWDARWNSSYIPVIWGCNVSDEGYVESVLVTSTTLSHELNGTVDPVRAGYEFVGWSLTSGAQLGDFTAEEFKNIPVGSTVYAVWRSTSD